MSFKIKAADGKPLEIEDGEYYFNTKARGRRMMANSLSSDARRVYACLELATMGFQQELAVTMDRGERRPLAPTDICQQTGLSRQHVRRGLEDLETAGLASRKAPDGGALRKGQVLIYSWAVPHEPKKEDCSRARLQLPDWFPDSWEPFKPLINRFKYRLPQDEERARGYIEAGAAAARVYKEAEIEATRILESVCAEPEDAPPSLYVERTERTTTERTYTSSSAVVSVRGAGEKAEEEDRDGYRQFKTAYPADHFDEPKTKPSFEKKTRAEQTRILERLQIYLICDRWRDDGGHWIPFASKWLESYEAEPPPTLKKAPPKQSTKDAVIEEAKRRYAKYGRI